MRGQEGKGSSGQEMAVLQHELRTTLNGIMGMTRLLGETGLRGRQRWLLEALEESGHQLQWLIDTIEDQNRERLISTPAQTSVIDGVELLERSMRRHQQSVIGRKVDLLLILDPRLPRQWRCNRHVLQQLLDNLLSNAIKFTNAGTVQLEARRSDSDPGVPGGMELIVSDTGIGISEQAIPHIFEPWRRAEHSISEGYQGSGLGLHVCRQIVAAMDGRIQVSSQPEKGSRFRVVLPDVIGESAEPGKRGLSRLLSSLSCELEVREPVRRSLTSLLLRLGVRISAPRGELNSVSAGELPLAIREPVPADQATCGIEYLLAVPLGQASGLRTMPLYPPYLESSLAPVLLELVLAWRAGQSAL